MKAYDGFNWDILRLILLQVGLSLEARNWIMGCVSSANFATFVNGEINYFFKSSMGLKHGCPLSPLLFIFIVKGLIMLIYKAKSEGKLQGFEIALALKITLLLFVDGVLLFGVGTVEE